MTGGANYEVRADDFAWESLPDWITVTPVMKNGKNYLSVYCYPYSEIGAMARNHTIIVYGRAENGSFIDASFEVVQRPHPYATPEYLTLCTAESRKVNILYANGDYKIYDSPLWCKFTSIKNDYFEVRQDPDVKSPQPGTIIVTVPSGKDTFIPIMIEVYPEAEKDVLSCPDGNHPHAIDLGIGIKWACCNVGAYAPTGYGGFYAWGETSTKSYYYWDTYKWYDEGADMLTRYCTMSEEGIVDNITTLLPSDDIAHCSFGGSWRMPTAGECDALITLCSSVWTEIDGVVGRLFTGPNGNRIFLPAGGSFWKGEISGRGQYGRFWSSSLCPGSPRSAYNFGIKNDLAYSSNYSRYDGRTIRPVTQ